MHHDPVYGDIIPPFGDSGYNYSGPARIDRMIRYFNDEADVATDDSTAMEIDIIGFSRGAAEARDFANQIALQTLDGIYSYTERQGREEALPEGGFPLYGSVGYGPEYAPHETLRIEHPE